MPHRLALEPPLAAATSPFTIERAENTLTYHANDRGSIVALTDDTRRVVQTYLTDESCVPAVLDGEVGLVQPFLFTGNRTTTRPTCSI